MAVKLPNPVDQELARQMSMGDQEALKKVATLHGRTVRAVLLAKYGEWEDAYSIALMRLWAAAGRYRPEKASLGTWFTAIALRCAAEVIEERRRQLPPEWLAGETISVVKVGAPEPGEPPASNSQTLKLRHVISNLPEMQRRVIEGALFRVPGQRDADLGRELGMTALAVRQNRLKAMRKIRAAFSQLDEPGVSEAYS
jgi:RNA polymerase sigma factor (sigma-70 family)